MARFWLRQCRCFSLGRPALHASSTRCTSRNGLEWLLIRSARYDTEAGICMCNHESCAVHGPARQKYCWFLPKLRAGYLTFGRTGEILMNTLAHGNALNCKETCAHLCVPSQHVK